MRIGALRVRTAVIAALAVIAAAAITGCTLVGLSIPQPIPPRPPAEPTPPRSSRQSVDQVVNTEPVLNFNAVTAIQNVKGSTFAVLDFGATGVEGAAGILAADTFYISLAGKGMKIIERERIKQITAEQQLVAGSRDLSDEEKARRIGRIVGADYMIFGAVTEYKSEVRDVQLGSFVPDKDRQRYAEDYDRYQRELGEYQRAYAEYLKQVRDWNDKQLMMMSGLHIAPTPVQRKAPQTIEQWEDEYAGRGVRNALATVASIGLTARVIDVKSGQIIWVGQGAKRHLQLQEGAQILISKLVETILRPSGS